MFSIYKLHTWTYTQRGRTSAGATGNADYTWEIDLNCIVYFVFHNAAELFSLFLYTPMSYMQDYM